MTARRTDAVEQAAQTFALRCQTDWLFLHEVLAAFTGSDMRLGGSHGNAIICRFSYLATGMIPRRDLFLSILLHGDYHYA
jgi:hypothetical protein